MKFIVVKQIPVEEESPFVRATEVIPWIVSHRTCDLCGIMFEFLDYHKAMVIIAESEHRRYHFCEECWESDKVLKEEQPESQ